MDVTHLVKTSIELVPAKQELIYLDPGSGSLIIQMLVAAIAGAGFFFRSQIRRVFGMFKRSGPEKKTKAKRRKAK